MPDSDPGDSRRAPEPYLSGKTWLTLDIVHDAGDWQSMADVDRLVQTAGDALARHHRFAERSPADACVALSDDACVHKLNTTFRAIDKPTNVLSFPAGPSPTDGDALPHVLGDVVLAEETVRREARDMRKRTDHHLQHLVVHGLLHLLGFDHKSDSEAAEMEGLETEILSDLQIPDPYADQDAMELHPS